MTSQELSLSRFIGFLRDKIAEEHDPEERQRLMRFRLEAEHNLRNARRVF